MKHFLRGIVMSVVVGPGLRVCGFFAGGEMMGDCAAEFDVVHGIFDWGSEGLGC